MAKAFEELECRKLTVELDAKVYKFVNKGEMKTLFSQRDQMLRSAGSIADNIAEGFERGGNKEFIRFLSISKGSCSEIRSQFHRCKMRDIIDEATFTQYYNECRTTSVKINNLITHLKNSELKGNKYKVTI